MLESRCIRLNGQGSPWRALFDEHLEELVHADSPAEFESRMNAVVGGGGLSHVAFFHQSAQRAPARYAINATFSAFDTPDGPRWLFQDVHDGGPAHAAGIRPGDLLLRVNGRSIAPPELPTFALGTDAQVTIKSADGAARDVTSFCRRRTPGRRRRNHRWPNRQRGRSCHQARSGISKGCVLPRRKRPTLRPRARSRADRIHDCSRLIVDLRGNLGGFVGLVAADEPSDAGPRTCGLQPDEKRRRPGVAAGSLA